MLPPAAVTMQISQLEQPSPAGSIILNLNMPLMYLPVSNYRAVLPFSVLNYTDMESPFTSELVN